MRHPGYRMSLFADCTAKLAGVGGFLREPGAAIVITALRPHPVRFERFEDCGHGPWGNQPDKAFPLFREFILS